MVNLTVLLVLATFFLGISSTLPTTSYVKMVDLWMIFTMLYPFCEVLIHTISHRMRNHLSGDYGSTTPLVTSGSVQPLAGNTGGRSGSKYRTSLDSIHTMTTLTTDWVMPVLSAMFILPYWIVGLYTYNCPDPGVWDTLDLHSCV